MLKPKLFLILLCFLFSVGTSENFTVTQVEYYERVENLVKEKYASSQYEKIVGLLESKEQKIRVMSYNILFNLTEDKQKEENKWPCRLPRLVKLIEEVKCDILNVQELYPSQLKDLMPYLQGTFACVYCKREFGELNAIFYRKDRFALLKSHVEGLEEGSYAFISDTVTMAQLKDLITGKTLAVFNIHLAFSPPDVRERQSLAIVELIKTLPEDMPIILTGDFNTFPNHPDKNLPFYDGDYVMNIFKDGGLKETKDCAWLGHVGPLSTFTNAEGGVEPFNGTGTPGVFLDHIFVSKGLEVLVHAVESGRVEGHFPSDHMPIFMDCLLK